MSRPTTTAPTIAAAAALITAAIVGVAIGLAVFGGPERGGLAARSGTLEGSGRALIGGAFELTHVEKGSVRETILDQPVNFVYFGFTHCPDFCPTELANLREARRLLAERGIESRTIFITVDPERDTPEIVQTYVEFFDPDAIGLSGARDQIDQAMSVYRVYAQATEKDESGYYAVDHSTLVYAMSADGELIKHFSANTDPQLISDELGARVSGAS